MTSEEELEFFGIDPAAEGYLLRFCREKRFEKTLHDHDRLSAQIAKTRATYPDHPSLGRADAMLADLDQILAAHMRDYLDDFRPQGRAN